jgi:16S rRNA (cytidine1402-2'-O)-methyltransferase
MHSSSGSGTLYIVATPIGNLADISLRMEQILSEVDLIACEDTRHTRKLMSHLGITTPLTSYYREKEQQKSRVLLEKLRQGQNISLVSDAGTPGLSDPGAVLVRAARSADIRVCPVPGPSALATALSVAGLVESSFFLGGFLPAKAGERRRVLTSIKEFPCPLIFYESPHRIQKTLADCLKILGNRDAQLFRELTKMHEQYYAGSLKELVVRTGQKIRGELVLVVAGQNTQPVDDAPEDLDACILWYQKQQNISLKDAVRHIATDLDLSRSRVYQRALELWHKK